MTKQEFFEFLDKSLENSTLEEKVVFVRDVLPNQLNEYLETLTFGKKYCSECKKYIDTEHFAFYEETSVETDSCHSELLEVKVKAIYSKCPCCGNVRRELILSKDILAWL